MCSVLIGMVINRMKRDYGTNGRSAGFQRASLRGGLARKTCTLEACGPAVCSIISLHYLSCVLHFQRNRGMMVKNSNIIRGICRRSAMSDWRSAPTIKTPLLIAKILKTAERTEKEIEAVTLLASFSVPPTQ